MVLSVGLIGCGFGGAVHARVLAADPRVHLCAVAASRVEKARVVADACGADMATADWRALIQNQAVAAVVIATPPAIQELVAGTALARGLPVFAEKPLALSFAGAKALADAAGELPNMVDYSFPELVAFSQTRDLLAQGIIGGVRHVVVNWQVETVAVRKRLDMWKTAQDQGGGVIYNFASHVLQYLEFLLAPVCGPIIGLTARRAWLPGDSRTGESLVTLALELESGAGISASVSAGAWGGSGHSIEIYGEDGRLRLENRSADHVAGFVIDHADRASGAVRQLVPSEPWPGDGADNRMVPTGRIIERFIDWCLGGPASGPSFVDATRTQQLIDAAFVAHETGCWVATHAQALPGKGS